MSFMPKQLTAEQVKEAIICWGRMAILGPLHQPWDEQRLFEVLRWIDEHAERKESNYDNEKEGNCIS